MSADRRQRRGRAAACLSRINQAAAALAAALILFMLAAITHAVAMRFLFNQPVAWVVEVSSFLLLYVTFLGAAWLLEKDGHVDIDLVTGALSPRRRAALKAASSVCGAAVSLVLAWKGAAVTLDYFTRQVTVIGILNVPQYLLMGVIPLGAALLCLQFVLTAARSARAAAAAEDHAGGPR